MLVPALIAVGETRYAARVLNLSTTGALLSSSSQFDVGSLVTLTCGTIDIAATVVHRGDETLGVTFLAELDQDDIRRQADRTAAVRAIRQPSAESSPID